MYDDDLDALAAEYVLGTLSAEERGHAEALLLIDPGFVEIVRQWERRLGELNVMVEAVEPPAEVWDKIKSEIGTVAPSDEVRLAPLQPSALAPAAKTQTDTKAEVKTEGRNEGEELPLLAALASSLLSSESMVEGEGVAKAEAKSPNEWLFASSSPLELPKTERSADVFYLAHHLRRWRLIALGAGALAAVLALLIVLSQVAPGVIPPGGFHVPLLFARSPATPTAQDSRLVAVLQQDPTSPAFLLTIDPTSLTLTVRRVSAKAEAGHSYELWVVAPRSAKPRSLGVVGGGEFTQRPLPADFDLDTMRAATYEISFEPGGGSSSGAPSGPILFTGKMVELVPASPPPPKS